MGEYLKMVSLHSIVTCAALAAVVRCASYSSIPESVESDDWHVAMQMIRGGAHDLNARNEYHETALHMASAPHRAHESGLQTLIEAGADLDVQVSASIRL